MSLQQFPMSHNLNICSWESKAESAIIRELKKPQVVAELDPSGVHIELVPPCSHPVSPQVGAVGFSQFRVSFMPSAPCSGTWHSSRAQRSHGFYTLAPETLEAFTLSEQTSGQMATIANRHGINSTDTKHVILHPVMNKLFIFIAVSDSIAVNYMGDTVRGLPIQPMQTRWQQDFSEFSSRHNFSLLNHIVGCKCASLRRYQLLLKSNIEFLDLDIAYMKILGIKLERKQASFVTSAWTVIFSRPTIRGYGIRLSFRVLGDRSRIAASYLYFCIYSSAGVPLISKKSKISIFERFACLNDCWFRCSLALLSTPESNLSGIFHIPHYK